MDINFHYFTMKAAAYVAGFPEEEAQTIASYSQFVDDYTNYTPIPLKTIPQFAQYLATKTLDGWNFHPITTGFGTLVETARLITPENQDNILAPFHFMPDKALNQGIKDRRELRTIPVPLQDTSIDSLFPPNPSNNPLTDKLSSLFKKMVKKKGISRQSLIKSLLINAKQKYQLDTPHAPSLIRIGILLHIYADTYAHQRFSGFHGWENHTYLTSVHDNRKNNKNITISYKPIAYFMVPSLGHANVGHAPDQTHITFTIKQKNSENSLYTDKYSRNNTEMCLQTTKNIINYLRSCLGKEPLNEDEWNLLSDKFRQGFLAPNENDLMEHWHNIFTDTNFNYNKNNQYQVDDNFFHYNIIADKIKRHVQGEKL